MNKQELIEKIQSETNHTTIAAAESLAITLLNVYITLQRNASKSVSFAVKSDATRAIIRNKLSEYTTLDAQVLQESVEEIAASY